MKTRIDPSITAGYILGPDYCEIKRPNGPSYAFTRIHPVRQPDGRYQCEAEWCQQFESRMRGLIEEAGFPTPERQPWTNWSDVQPVPPEAGEGLLTPEQRADFIQAANSAPGPHKLYVGPLDPTVPVDEEAYEHTDPLDAEEGPTVATCPTCGQMHPSDEECRVCSSLALENGGWGCVD